MDRIETEIRDGMVIAFSQTTYYQRQIPEGGLGIFDLHHMTYWMNVQGMWLVTELNRHQGAGPLVSHLATLRDPAIRNVVDRLILENRPFSVALSHLVTVDEPMDSMCAICLETNTEGQTWSRTTGCTWPHCFHTNCLTQWTGKCPVCRA
jgi:hypothetical protein